MDTKDFSSIPAIDDFCYTIGFSFCDRLRIPLKVSSHRCDFKPFFFTQFLSRGFGQPYIADFWMSECCGWNAAVIYTTMTPTNILDCGNALSGGGMSQHHLTCCITNRPQMRYGFAA